MTTWDGFMEAPGVSQAKPEGVTISKKTEPPPMQATIPPPALTGEKPPAALKSGGFFGFDLHPDVMDNSHWKGDESDLKFGLREPEAEEVFTFAEQLARSPGPEVVLPYLAAGGRHRGGLELTTWWHTRTGKVQMSILQEFVALVLPTDVDVIEMESTRRRDGDRIICSLPMSVMDSRHWKGGPVDLAFALRDATTAEVRRLSSRAGSIDDCVQFIVSAGGNSDPREWWSRLSPKAQMLVNRTFVASIQPTDAEGKAVRASRVWVEG